MVFRLAETESYAGIRTVPPGVMSVCPWVRTSAHSRKEGYPKGVLYSSTPGTGDRRMVGSQ